MLTTLVPDDLWNALEPLLPPEPSKARGGRPRVPARRVLAGIVYVLKTGVPWHMLPPQLGFGSGKTCLRRLLEWHAAGVWQALHRALLERLARAGRLDWSRCSLDSASIPAPKGAS